MYAPVLWCNEKSGIPGIPSKQIAVSSNSSINGLV